MFWVGDTTLAPTNGLAPVMIAWFAAVAFASEDDPLSTLPTVPPAVFVSAEGVVAVTPVCPLLSTFAVATLPVAGVEESAFTARGCFAPPPVSV